MYTVEVYKKDARTKKGERLVSKTDYDTDNLSMLEHTVKHTWRASQGFRYEIHETYVTRKNRRNNPDRITLKKYDPVARKHVEFKEAKIK